MNATKKIEQYLRDVPKPPAPDGLLNRLQEDAAVTNVKPHVSVARRFFAPTGQSISLRRVATAAAIAIVIMLPLTYGAAKVIKYFAIELTFEYPDDNTMYSISSTVSSDKIDGEENARKALEEFRRLYEEGEAQEIKPGVWVATLSNGEEFAYAGDPERAGLIYTEEGKQLLKEQFDEIHKLKKAGKYDRTFIEVIERDGVKIRLYQDSFILSNSKVVTLTTCVSKEESPKDEDQD